MQSTIPIIGVYKLTHTPSGKFYIGSSSNIYHRYHVHLTYLSRWKHTKSLQSLWTGNKFDWTITVLEHCKAQDLLQLENVFLSLHKGNPDLLNVRSKSSKTIIGHRRATRSNHQSAYSLLGKNTPDQIIRRPSILNLVAPDGTVYHNVISVNKFSKDHNLHQSAMTNLVNGKYPSHLGWTVENGNLPSIGVIENHWSEERIAQHYPLYTIIGPNNEVYTTYNLVKFQAKHNCVVIQKLKSIHKDTKGFTQTGQGYRLSTVPTYTITVDNHRYNNVLCISALAHTLGIHTNIFLKAAKGEFTRRNITVTIQ
jgi:group I intron endonuclease